ncbi:hypothetical protein [Flindersiella endophytica]
MALAEALLVLAERWDEVLAGLDSETSELLERHAAELVAAKSSAVAAPVADQLLDILAEHLPVDHPIFVAMYADQAVRFTSSKEAWPQIAAGLRRYLNVGASESQLLEVDAYRPDQIEWAGVDPSRPDLIRLEAPDGSIRLPAFQFDNERHPLPLVLEINRLLDADIDPWGVADWWLGQNIWLGDRPVNLIDPDYPDTLLAAARAELED